MRTTKRTQKQVTKSIRFVRGPRHGISEYLMANGMKILLMPDTSSTAITSLVAYRVGSRNEGAGNTGSAHFFEHLMFKGSKSFNPDNGLNIDLLTKEVGAQLNAYTSDDQTVYHIQAPPQHLEMCLAIEADRMRHLRVRVADRDSEMTVVRNEMERGENSPQQVMNKLMFATAFTQHPYHHDTIGSRTEVENVPLPTMRAFYETYYWPNNATFIIVGNFDPQNALDLLEKHFGKIPQSPHRIPTVYTVEPRQEGEKRFEVRRAGTLYRLSLGFHVPEATHADIAPLNVMAQVLGSSYSCSSRLYKRLVDTGLASRIYAYVDERRDPSLLMIDVDLNKQTSLAQAEAAVLEEIERLKTEPVPAEELSRIKIGNRKSNRLRLAEPKYFGYQLAQAEGVADWTSLLDGYDAFDAVTPADMLRVAKLYLGKDNRTVGAFVPKSEAEVEAERSQQLTAAEPPAVATKPRKERKSARAVPADAIGKAIARFTGALPQRKPLRERIQSRTLANGLTVHILPEKPGSGAVAVATSVKAGNYYEGKDVQGLADIVGSMLTMGSQGLTKVELAEEMTQMGIQHGLSSWVGAYLQQTRTQLVTEDLPRYLELLSMVLRYPTFDASELEKVKDEWRARFQKQAEDPGSVAATTLGNVIYTKEDSFFQKTLAEQEADLERMTVEELFAYHRAQYTPGNTDLILVGDIDAAVVFAEAERIFGSWQGAASPKVNVPQPAVRKPEGRIVKQMPDKPGISIVLGHVLTLKRGDSDWDAAHIAFDILGGDTLTARLGKRLREEGGLTYGVYFTQWDSSYGGAPCYIDLSVNKLNVEAALAKTEEIVRDFVARGITEAELATQVNEKAGSFQLRLSTLPELASQLASFVALGINLDRIDSYPADLRKLTCDQVNEAIRKHLRPENLVTIVAGDV